MDNKATIAEQFNAEDNQRQIGLDSARECSALTKPWVLPPRNQTADSKLPENYQSIGARGITSLEGKMLLAIFPPDQPWFGFALSDEIAEDPSIPDAKIQQLEDALFIRQLVVLSALESGNRVDGNDEPLGFRTVKRRAIAQCLITGDVLEWMRDDFRITVFAREDYVTLRDSTKRVIHHIVREDIDPLSLDDSQIAMAKLDNVSIAALPAAQRMQKLHTRIQWQPRRRVWVIEQELNGVVINSSEEKFTPFFSTPFDLVGKENYGRGLVEANRGDLKSTDELTRRVLDLAEVSSRVVPILDYSAEMRETDLQQPTGKCVRGRVAGGVWQDGCLLKADKLSDFKVVNQVLERIEARLGGAFLIGSETVRPSERTTAYEVAETVIKELEGALGGAYAPIADFQQIPIVRRAVHLLERQNLLPPLPPGTVQIKTLTGIAALARQVRAGRMLSFAETVTQLGPEAAAKLDMGVLVDVLARLQGAHERGLVLTNEEAAAKEQQQIATATQMAAAQKGVDVAGNVAEAHMTPQAPPGR
jgi:hypothetical protein